MEELKATRFEIEQQLNPLLCVTKVTHLSNEDKNALFDLKIKLTDITNSIFNFRKDTADSIDKPENFEKLFKNANSSDATEQDKAEWNKVYKEYREKFENLTIDYLNAIESIPFNFVSKDSFQKLMDDNDFKLAEYEYIYKKLVK